MAALGARCVDSPLLAPAVGASDLLEALLALGRHFHTARETHHLLDEFSQHLQRIDPHDRAMIAPRRRANRCALVSRRRRYRVVAWSFRGADPGVDAHALSGAFCASPSSRRR